MDEKTAKNQEKVFKITCPLCKTILWIDPELREVIKTEKGKKKKSSLDEMLLKEKKKKNEVDLRFKSTSALEREKRKEADEKFNKVFSAINKKS